MFLIFSYDHRIVGLLFSWDVEGWAGNWMKWEKNLIVPKLNYMFGIFFLIHSSASPLKPSFYTANMVDMQRNKRHL